MAFGLALLVQPGFDFFGVALMVQGKQAVEDDATGGLADGVAHVLLGRMEAVAQVEGAGAGPGEREAGGGLTTWPLTRRGQP